MIDVTTFQTNPIPKAIVDLQKTNADLNTENNMLKTAIYIGVGALTAYLIYRMYKKYKEDEASKNIQSIVD